MPNSIPAKQNTAQALDRLAAQRHLYSRAKHWILIQIAVALPVAFMLSLLANIFPSFNVWATLYGITASIVDVAIWESLQLALKQTAAKVQELFDCAVLDIGWHHSRVGSFPDPEVVAEAAAAYRHKHSDISDLIDWYAISVGNLSPEMGRVICQRTNCQWDSHLRGRYTKWLLGTLMVAALLIFSVGLYRGMTLERFVLAILAPLSPAWLWGIREWKKQRAAAESADRLKAHANEIWAAALAGMISGEFLETKARDLQDEIYERRRTNPLIFDWIYYWLQDEQEEQASKAADELVQEALGSAMQPKDSEP
jgi:hypothetical protein